jgi:hypothetical protein
MAIVIGQTTWQPPLALPQIPVGSTVLGGILICKSGTGVAWIVAPASTQVCSSWNGSTSTTVGNMVCASAWPALSTALINAGFNPTDWFVPTPAQISNPGYACRSLWDSFCCTCYWSSTESGSGSACVWNMGNNTSDNKNKAECHFVRAFRCVTY